VIIAYDVKEDQQGKFLRVLGENEKVIGWSLSHIKGIIPSIMQHKNSFGG